MKKIFFVFSIIFLFLSCDRNQLAKLPPDPKESNSNHLHSRKKKEEPHLDEQKPQTPVEVKPQPTLTPSKTEVNVNSLTGTVLGVQTSQLSFRVNGYIEEVYVKNGDYVKKGQVIARLDKSIALEQLKLSKYALEQANSAQHFAQLTLKRTQTLNQRQATTQIALEQAQSNYQNSLIAVKQADANLKLAQINYDETNLTAPFDGTLFNISAWIGNYVSSTTTIATITSTNGLQIQIPVPQTVVNNFSLGQEYSFANSSQKTRGTLKITGIVPYVDANTKTYLLYASPSHVQGQLMAGELVIVDLK